MDSYQWGHDLGSNHPLVVIAILLAIAVFAVWQIRKGAPDREAWHNRMRRTLDTGMCPNCGTGIPEHGWFCSVCHAQIRN